MINNNVIDLLPKNHIKIGEKIEFKANMINWQDFELKIIKKEYKIISTIPSIDTNVCLIQTKKFNEKIINNYNYIKLITISRDLPFALNRVCKYFVHSDHILLSDANYREFGINTKLFFDFNNLLVRSIIILDKHNKVIYLQIVPIISSEPNYEEIYKFLDNIKNKNFY